MKEYTVDTLAPNFDDERTVQTARRVVPLEQIEAKTRHRRQWFLGGAFAMAMMLGAATALLASYFKTRNAPAVATEVSQQELTAAPLAVAESVPTPDAASVNETDDAALAAVAEEETEIEAPKKETPAKPKTVVKHSQYIPEPREAQKASEEDELEQIRKSVLIDEWQERRARRVWRRERRLRERYNHRDLSNLDEIFEGRRRPQ